MSNKQQLVASFKNWLMLCTARLSRRIAFWVFLSIIIIETIILIPSVDRRQKELLTQLKEVTDIKIDWLIQDNPQISPQNFLKQLQQIDLMQPLIMGGIIYSLDGKEISFLGEMPQFSLVDYQQGKQPNLRLNNLNRYEMVRLINLANKDYILVLRLNTSDVKQEVYSFILRIAGLVIIISVFVTIGTLIALQLIIIAPILKLRNDLIEAGKAARLNQPPPKFASQTYFYQDELKDVITAFSEMYQQVWEAIIERKQTEGKLAKLNLQLETRVRERTAALEDANHKLTYNAYHDSLTGLPNRAFLIEHLQQALATKYSEQLFAVLFLDVDHFKIINDSLGHTFGDQLLIAIAQRIETCLYAGQFVARLGGDEFAVFLHNIHHQEDAVEVATNIQEKFIEPFDLSGNKVFTTISIGIAISSKDYNSPEAILRDADLVMYRAKNLGRSCYAVFDAQMHERLVASMKLEMDLRKAVNSLKNAEENSGFELYYQPIINMQTGHIYGFEALIRWHHPESGFVSPIHFIPKAEETGLIVNLGSWIFKKACEQMSIWHQEFPHLLPLQMSINLSTRQLLEDNLLDNIKNILNSTGLDGAQLKLEITETTLMDNTELIQSILLKIKEQKIKLSMDDFGTGYSSLSYLHKFPFDTLKIDRSFINYLGTEEDKENIVKTIVNLAHCLGMNVIAEGVETPIQVAKLTAMSCQLGQGYLFSRPVDSMAAKKILTKGNLLDIIQQL